MALKDFVLRIRNALAPNEQNAGWDSLGDYRTFERTVCERHFHFGDEEISEAVAPYWYGNEEEKGEWPERIQQTKFFLYAAPIARKDSLSKDDRLVGVRLYQEDGTYLIWGMVYPEFGIVRKEELILRSIIKEVFGLGDNYNGDVLFDYEGSDVTCPVVVRFDIKAEQED